MSITIHIYYTGTGGNACKFAREMEDSGTASLIRNEDGNIRYEYFMPLHNAETVLLIDSWADQEAIDCHHTSPMMKKISDLRNKYDLHMRVERYISDDSTPKDAQYIRE